MTMLSARTFEPLPNSFGRVGFSAKRGGARGEVDFAVSDNKITPSVSHLARAKAKRAKSCIRLLIQGHFRATKDAVENPNTTKGNCFFKGLPSRDGY